MRLGFNAAVEPNRTVKGSLLFYQEMTEFCFKSICFLGRNKVAALLAPSRNGVNHPADQLLHAGFAAFAIPGTTKVFGYNYIRSQHRPGRRNLYVGLFKYDVSLFISNDSLSLFPFDLFEWMHSWFGENSFEVELSLLADFARGQSRCLAWLRCLLH